MNLSPLGRTELTIAGGGCACCEVDPASPSTRTDAAASVGLPFMFGVDGMTCSNCVRHVTEELIAVDGIDSVEVALVVGGVSTVTVRSTALVDDDVIAAAVADAGYRVVPR